MQPYSLLSPTLLPSGLGSNPQHEEALNRNRRHYLMPIITSVPFGLIWIFVHLSVSWNLECCFTLYTSPVHNINDRYDRLMPSASPSWEGFLRRVLFQAAVKSRSVSI